MSYTKFDYAKDILEWEAKHGKTIYVSEIELPNQMKPKKVRK